MRRGARCAPLLAGMTGFDLGLLPGEILLDPQEEQQGKGDDRGEHLKSHEGEGDDPVDALGLLNGDGQNAVRRGLDRVQSELGGPAVCGKGGRGLGAFFAVKGAMYPAFASIMLNTPVITPIMATAMIL